jgi:hydroxymethylglutaryl-CoA reductase
MSDDKVKTLEVKRTSRLSGFYRQSPERRRARLVEARWVAPEEVEQCAGLGGFDEGCADAMVENVIGLHGLPLGLALNFIVNGRDRLVPVSVEESSVIAVASYAARLCSEGGGFTVEADPPITTAQVQLLDVPSLEQACVALLTRTQVLLEQANALMPRMCARGGGALHARRVAAEVGASGELVEAVAALLSHERVYRPERARELLAAEVARRQGGWR